jgi:hypothetical protein
MMIFLILFICALLVINIIGKKIADTITKQMRRRDDALTAFMKKIESVDVDDR